MPLREQKIAVSGGTRGVPGGSPGGSPGGPGNFPGGPGGPGAPRGQNLKFSGKFAKIGFREEFRDFRGSGRPLQHLTSGKKFPMPRFFREKKNFFSPLQEKNFFSPRETLFARLPRRAYGDFGHSVDGLRSSKVSRRVSARLFGVDRRRGMQASRAARKVVCASARRVRRSGRSAASTGTVGKRTRPAWRRLYPPGGVSPPTSCRRTSSGSWPAPRAVQGTSPNGDSGPPPGDRRDAASCATGKARLH